MIESPPLIAARTPDHSSRLRSIRHGASLLLAALLSLSGCAEESGITTVPVGDMGGETSLDMPADLAPVDQGEPVEPDLGTDQGPLDMENAGDDGAEDDAGTVDMEGDLIDMPPPPEVSYLLCALGQRAPWGDCFEEDRLDFGRVPAAQRVERLARIDNDGDLPIVVTGSVFSQAEYAVTWRTYDRAQPPVEMEQTLPYTIEPGESLFAVVSLFGGLTMATLPDTQLEISVDTGAPGGQQEILTLELTARYDGCAIGMASCDMDVTNGCETNVTNDILHCGGCDMPCSLDHATPQCAGSSCLVASCDAGYGNCDMMQGNGCETDTDTSLDHCGGCNQPCSYPQADTTCESGSCIFEQCVGSWADCDADLATNGCESNTSNDVQHCGGCGMACDYANALEVCTNSTCLFQGCEADHYNLDGDLSNGCEYFCQKQGTSDLPDTQYTDANCDGIDGDIQQAVFVSTTGSDGNSGGMSDPFRTLGQALNVAATTSGVTQVLVASGNYEEQVFLVNGVHIAGGYQANAAWQRHSTAISRTHWRQAMSKRVVAMSGSNITTDTWIHQMTVEAEDSSALETSTYGLHCASCTSLRIEQSTFIAGDAGHGAAGIDGANGPTNSSTSGRGSNGRPGSCDSSSSTNFGGSGGISVCGRPGGSGGRGGSKGDNQGSSGLTGFSGTPGGTGGSGGNPGRRGNNGTNGADGANGANGAGGSSGSLINGYWVGHDGASGTSASHGNGGGGGGGGGGQGCFFCDDGAGSGGGGGGAGGCAGVRGTGGTAGGSSFALFLYQSNGITLTANSFRAGNGGDGGAGGDGGTGSSGMAGGTGAATCTDEIGAGGNGGAGGDGGDGGDGGGGAGGNSYAVWREQTTTGLPGTNILTYGQAGAGGSSQGNAGGMGQAGTYR